MVITRSAKISLVGAGLIALHEFTEITMAEIESWVTVTLALANAAIVQRFGHHRS